MELLERRKLTTNLYDKIVIDLQITTNERFLTDLTKLATKII